MGGAGGWVAPPLPPPAGATRASIFPPSRRGTAGSPPHTTAALRGRETHLEPKRVAHANVTSLHLHWHMVAEWRADVVLNSRTRRTAFAQQVMRAHAGPSGGRAFSGAPLESQGGGGLGFACRGGWAS